MNMTVKDGPSFGEVETEMNAAGVDPAWVEAFGNLTPLEGMLAGKIVDSLSTATSLIGDSMGLEAAQRFNHAIAATCASAAYQIGEDIAKKDK